MTINERPVGAVIVLDLRDRLTIDSAGLLKDKVYSLLLQGRLQFVLNFSDVTYIDSTGLGEIVAAYTSVTRKNGRICLASLTRRVHDLLVITKLVTVFDVFESEAEAVKSFSAADGGA